MKKTVGIISTRPGMARFYAGIIKGLASDFAELHTCSVEDESIRSMPPCDLYVSSVTSYDVMLDRWVRDYLPPESQIVPMEVSFSKAAVDLLRTYPEGTKAILLNQNKHMTMECIAQLYHLGISNIEFYPCYPGIEKVPEQDLLFTVGEPDLVPEGIPKVIDIGSRLPSASTLCEMALKLGNPFFLESDHFRRYRSRLANAEYSLLSISSQNLTNESKLEMILNSLDEGIVCIDENNEVKLINREARRQLDVSRSEVLNKKVNEVLPMLPFEALWKQAKEMPDGGTDGKEQDSGNAPAVNRLLPPAGPFLLNIRGMELGVTVFPLRIGDQNIGAFAALQGFHESERQQNTLRLQKTRKSHTARASFEDIIGSSPELIRAKGIARKMATNDAAVLLEGESGTGKALFAQAIHNASLRAGEAFVPVSCAALNDEMLETELFGYAEGYNGSSTGRTGLIEFAHRGTLFLDSIESMSTRMQAYLLRVLREREFTRPGSDEPVSVDVRVISATSEDILKKVQEGSFRRDLYYRLNVIPIHIPTLWEHRSDVPQLIDYFRKKKDTEFELTDRARVALLQHRWEGNVRELENCIEYLKYTGIRMVDIDDLPDVVKESRNRAQLRAELEKRSGLQFREYLVLRELGEVYGRGTGLGRQMLVSRCLSHGNAVSEHEVREILKKLDEMGLVLIRPGRGGSCLTEAGYLKYRQIAHEGEETQAFL